MDKVKTKKKRVLKNPIKKWTISETKLIVDYLRENQRIEKPSAQVYYKKLLECHPEIVATWDLIRYKVKNMRVAYMKARDWVNGPGARLREADSIFFSERLHQICPFYDQLEEIFENKINIKVRRIVPIVPISAESDNSMQLQLQQEEQLQQQPIQQQQQDNDLIMPSSSSMKSSSSSSGVNLAKKIRKLYRTSLNELYELQKERKEELREKLAFKEKWKMAELEFQQQKLQFEKEKFWEEMNLKRLEIQSKERIRQMEIEKEKYEMELKYKCISSNEQ